MAMAGFHAKPFRVLHLLQKVSDISSTSVRDSNVFVVKHSFADFFISVRYGIVLDFLPPAIFLSLVVPICKVLIIVSKFVLFTKS